MTTHFTRRSLQGLPTLTEVIDLPVLDVPVELPPAASAPNGSPSPDLRVTSIGEAEARAAIEPVVDEARLVATVLVELQRHADLMLEYRLREAIEPALARLADGLVRDLREELATTLRDVVGRAVNQELARQRGRQP